MKQLNLFQRIIGLSWLIFAPLVCQAQVSIIFNNYVSGIVDAPVSAPYNGPRLSGSGYTAQLFAAPGPVSDDQFVPLFPTTTFRTDSAAGYVVAVTVNAPFNPAYIQMRVWDNNGGTIASYSAANLKGRSMTLNLAGPTAYLYGLQPFTFFEDPPLGVPPEITQQPHDVVIARGANAGFSVTAAGSSPLSYQWRFNGTNLFGATNSAYTLSPAVPANAGNYDVVVSNPYGTNVSATATLSFLDLNMFAGLVLDGPLGTNYRIDFNTEANTNWTVLTNIVLSTKPQVFIDLDSCSSPKRFYRAVPQ